jgi:hypothetical protein
MAEWLKAHAWKACIGETLSRVRIPLSPPDHKSNRDRNCGGITGQASCGRPNHLWRTRARRSYAQSRTTAGTSPNHHPITRHGPPRRFVTRINAVERVSMRPSCVRTTKLSGREARSACGTALRKASESKGAKRNLLPSASTARIQRTVR